MNFENFLYKLISRTKKMIRDIIFNKTRIAKYALLSTCSQVKGRPIKNGPVLLHGKGIISFGRSVKLGYKDSPFFYSGYVYLEARNIQSKIEIHADVQINNNTAIISEGTGGIIIGAGTLIGTGVTIYDSDFHELTSSRRIGGNPETAAVIIGKNVFIGSGVTILKGVTIGDNSVIGSGAVVNASIGDNVIAAGNPCRVIKPLTL